MSMEYRRMGKTGLRLSSLSLGAWITYGGQVKDEDATFECMKAAYDAGVNFFDNAESYSQGNAERVMGTVLKKTGWRRSSLVISTKLFFGTEGRTGPNDKGLSRKHIFEGLHESLARMQLDYVDLLFCHRPDPSVPIEETVRAMNDLIRQGKVFYWGTSEWNAQQLQEACTVADRLGLIPPLVEQPQYNMFCRSKVERDYLPLYAQSQGLGLTIWSPLASGLLSGKYNDGIPEGSRLALENSAWLKNQFFNNEGINGLEEKDYNKVIEKTKALGEVARDLECSTAQLSLAWCLRNEHVSTVITGASRVQQVTENLQALNLVQKLTPAVLERIENILQNAPVHAKNLRPM